MGRFQLALLLGIGLAAPIAAADPADDGDSRPGLNFHWASWMQENSRPAPKKKPPARKDKEKDKESAAPKPPPPKRSSVADRVSAERERESRIFLRRVAVCDELRSVAEKTHDEALERRAAELEKRAWVIYRQHTAHLPGHSLDVASDEQTLDRHLGQANAGEAGLQPASRNGRGSQVAVGEGKP